MRYVHRLTGPVLAATLVASCAFTPGGEEAAAPSAPLAALVIAEHSTPALPPAAPAVARTREPRTAVVVSADIPEYTEIAAEILRRGGNVTVYQLPPNGTNVLAEIGTAKPERIIAVGLPAAVAAKGFGDIP